MLRGKEEEDHRLGMEAVLRLYQERRAAVNDPTYSNVNEIRRSSKLKKKGKQDRIPPISNCATALKPRKKEGAGYFLTLR